MFVVRAQGVEETAHTIIGACVFGSRLLSSIYWLFAVVYGLRSMVHGIWSMDYGI